MEMEGSGVQVSVWTPWPTKKAWGSQWACLFYFLAVEHGQAYSKDGDDSGDRAQSAMRLSLFQKEPWAGLCGQGRRSSLQDLGIKFELTVFSTHPNTTTPNHPLSSSAPVLHVHAAHGV